MIRSIYNGISSVHHSFNNDGVNQKKEIQKSQHISRVEEIKKEIEQGTYKIDLDKTAQAMAKALLF
jgi:anti-sigma28 factor (negative regulator of flagellin synthesis)